jgi:hypothetical protein
MANMSRRECSFKFCINVMWVYAMMYAIVLLRQTQPQSVLKKEKALQTAQTYLINTDGIYIYIILL